MTSKTEKATQGGSVLLEAMISILIFAFGVLGIVGLQASMISSAAEAKYRSEAGFFANRLLGEMAASDRSSTAALSIFASTPPGPSYIDWYNTIQNTSVASGLLGLPGAADNPPTVTILPIINSVSGLPTSYNVTVIVRWEAPGQPQHRHVVTASISTD